MAPGDFTRELIHEVRNLTTTVALLHTVFVKRKVLYWILGVETFIVVAVLAGLSVFVVREQNSQNELITRAFGSCQVRNQQIDSTRTYLQRQLLLQQESQGVTAEFLSQLNLKFTPAEQKQIQKLTLDSQRALHDYFLAQPKDYNCAKFKGGAG